MIIFTTSCLYGNMIRSGYWHIILSCALEPSHSYLWFGVTDLSKIQYIITVKKESFNLNVNLYHRYTKRIMSGKCNCYKYIGAICILHKFWRESLQCSPCNVSASGEARIFSGTDGVMEINFVTCIYFWFIFFLCR